jgi:hypothetical protein
MSDRAHQVQGNRVAWLSGQKLVQQALRLTEVAGIKLLSRSGDGRMQWGVRGPMAASPRLNPALLSIHNRYLRRAPLARAISSSKRTGGF